MTLEALAEALRTLHKAMIGAVQLQYEKQHERVTGPGALLQLVLHDPMFAWLRPISAMIARLDEALDDPKAPAPPPAELQATIEGWMADPRYVTLLQEDLEVVIAHAALRRTLALRA